MKDLSKAAAPLETVLKGGDPEKTVVWACGTCKRATDTRESAVECCAPNICDACGNVFGGFYCIPCSIQRGFDKDKQVYDNAKKVPYASYGGGMLYCDHCEKYFSDVDELFDDHDDVEELPTYAWGTEEMTFSINAEEMVADTLERLEFHDDAIDNVSADALKELQVFLDAWAAKQKLTSYLVDFGVVVEFDDLAEAMQAVRDA